MAKTDKQSGPINVINLVGKSWKKCTTSIFHPPIIYSKHSKGKSDETLKIIRITSENE